MDLMLTDYLTKTLGWTLLHKFRDIIMVRVSNFALLEDTFSYTIKECVEKHTRSKYIPLGTGYPLKEKIQSPEN